MEKGGRHDEKFFESYYEYLKIALITMSMGRILLMVVSYKNIKICRVYIYYQILYLSLEWLLPRDYGEMQTNVMLSGNVMNFICLYYDFWPSCIWMLVTVVCQASMSVKHYGREVDA